DFKTSTATASFTIMPVNDAPTLDPIIPLDTVIAQLIADINPGMQFSGPARFAPMNVTPSRFQYQVE
ncbi:MAG: hypothetical protein DMF06_17525, partial [Verrucomicrobia bacterium]